jgi:replication factor A1
LCSKICLFFLKKLFNLFYLGCCRYLIVTKCEAVSPALEMEIKCEPTGITLKPKEDVVVKTEGAAGIVLTPKQNVVSKSAAQIVREQHAK